VAFYIKLTRILEDEVSAHYRFEGDGEGAGRSSVGKLSGEVTLMEPLAGDEEGHFFRRAAAKIRKEWKAGRLPDVTQWAS
jgi:hypothetical protein